MIISLHIRNMKFIFANITIYFSVYRKSMLTRTIHGPWNYYMNLKRCDIMHWLMTGQSSHPTAVGGVRS